MELLTIDEVAELFHCSRKTVRRSWNAGLIPKPIRIGRRSIRWRREELEEFITRRQGYEVPTNG